MQPRIAGAIVGLAAVATFTACSSGGGASSGAQAATAAGLQEAVEANADALLRRDFATTYETLSKDCRRKNSLREWTSQLVFDGALLEGAAASKLEELAIDRVETQNVTATTGQAQTFVVTLEGNKLPLEEGVITWVYEGGRWKAADCTGIGAQPLPQPAASDTTTTTGAISTISPTATPVAEAKPEEFLAKTNFATAPLVVTIDPKRYEELTYSEPFSDSYTITVDITREIGPTVLSPTGPIRAAGRFVGVRYRLDNGTDQRLSPERAFGDLVEITDGTQAWSEAEFTVVSATNRAFRTPQPTTEIRTDRSTTVWVVFDVPAGVPMKGLVLGLEEGKPSAMALPARA